jgi:HlyD family secretion protein
MDRESDVARRLGVDPPSRRGKKVKRRLIAGLLLMGAVTTAAVWRTADHPPAAQFKTQEARRGSLTVVVTATGTLQPTNKVDVSSELSGIIKNVEVDYNDRVKVGQILARLDTSKLEAQATQSRAALESARAKVLQAQATVRETRSKLAQLKRVWELSQRKVPSQSELDSAEAALDRAQADEASAKASVSQAQATLEANETDLSKAIIRSPINGVVLARSAEPGQTVAASFTAPMLFTLAEDLTQMDLHVNVDEADVGRVREGQKASFSVSAYPDRTFEARITQARYGSSTTAGVVTYETVLKVNNSDLSLRPGMTATANITVKEIKNATLIPTAALRFTPPATREAKSSPGLVEALLPRPPKSESKQIDAPDTERKQQRVWVLKNQHLSPVSIAVGSTSGGVTEVMSGDLTPGMAVAVDVLTGAE